MVHAGRNSHWIATSGQFIRLPGKTARAWLSEQQEETDAQIAAARQKLKALMQALLAEHPQVTDLQSGVCELLTEVKDGSEDPVSSPCEEAPARATGLIQEPR
eukprot:g24728.t1